MSSLNVAIIFLALCFLIINFKYAIFISNYSDDFDFRTKCNENNKEIKNDLKNHIELYGSIDDFIDFEGFDNQVPSEVQIIPNIVHFINLNQTVISFHQFISILSVWLNHVPKLIYIHCDNCNFKGKYWTALMNMNELKKIIKLHELPQKNKIFNTNIKWIHHRSDVLRLEVLMNYGGIYLDNDMIIVNSLKHYLHYEAVVSIIYENVIGNQIFIAHRNARILRAFYDQYRTKFDPENWYLNGGEIVSLVLFEKKTFCLF